MKQIFKLSFFTLVFAMMTFATQAQKYGYINSQGILAEMAEVKQMNSNLKTLGEQLQKKGQNMLTAYQTKEKNAVAKAEKGELSPLEQETLGKELQAEQQEIMKFEQEMQQQLAKKEQELLKPIIDRVNGAIAEVAKEKGYNMIFDAAVLLYAEEGTDVSTAVRGKLGM